MTSSFASYKSLPGGGRKKPNIGSRFVQDVREVAGGFIPGIAMIGGGIGSDIWSGAKELATGGAADTQFKTPTIAKGIGTAFMEQSFIPALFTGHPIEAYQRASERPFSAMLDLTGLVSGGAGLAQRGVRGAAKAGMIAPKEFPAFTRITGLRPVGEIPIGEGKFLRHDPKLMASIFEDPNLVTAGIKRRTPFEIGNVKFQPEMIGEDIYARPIARRVAPKDLPSNAMPNVWSKRSTNEFIARMGDAFHNKLMESNPNMPIVGAYSKMHRGLNKMLYSTRAALTDTFKRDYDSQVKKVVNSIDKEFPNLDPTRRQKAINYAVWIKMAHGADNADEFLASNEGFNGRFNQVPDEANPGEFRLEYEPNPDGAAKAIANHEEQILQRASDVAKTTDDIERARHEINVIRTADPLKVTNKPQLIEMQGIKIKGLQEKLAREGMDVDSIERRQRAIQSNLDEFINNEGATSWQERIDEIASLREEINAIAQSPAVENFMDYLGEISPHLEGMYLANAGGVFSGEDLEKFKYRNDLMLGKTLDEAKEYGGATKLSDGTKRERFFTPSLPQFSVDFMGKKTWPGKKIDNRHILQPRLRVGGDPDELIAKGANRVDLDIWRDKWVDEANDFSQNVWREQIADSMGIIQGHEADAYIKQKLATEVDNTGRKVSEGTPLVAVPASGSVANAVNSITRTFADMAAEAHIAGNNRLAELFSNIATELALPGSNPEVAMRAIISGSPGGELFMRQHRSLRAKGAANTGDYYLMPTHIYDAFVADAARSKHFLLRMLEAPTEVWKNMVLHLRPKWIVNNAVGSFLLLAMSEGMLPAVREMFTNSKIRRRLAEGIDPNGLKIIETGDGTGVYEFEVPAVAGARALAGNQYAEGVKLVKKSMTIPEYIEAMLPELTSSHGTSWLYRTEFLRNSDKKFRKRYVRLMDAIADFNAKIADDPARIAKASLVMRRNLDDLKANVESVRAQKVAEAEQRRNEIIANRDQYKSEAQYQNDLGIVEMDLDYAKTHTFDDGELVEYLVKDQGIREQMVDEVLSDMIDFQDMTPFERDYVRAIIPFWSWIKGSTKVTARSLYEHPIRMNAYAALSSEATRELEDRYGNLPSYILGSVPLPDFLQNKAGTRTISFGGMSPFSTGADIASLGAGFIPHFGSRFAPYGPESPIAMMGPIPKAALETLTQRDVFFGTPLPRGRTMGGTFLQRATQVPFLNVAQKHYDLLPYPTKQPRSTKATSERNLLFDVLSYMGAPHPMDLRLGAAHQRAKEEEREALAQK